MKTHMQGPKDATNKKQYKVVFHFVKKKIKVEQRYL
jgi:hypothetical protein